MCHFFGVLCHYRNSLFNVFFQKSKRSFDNFDPEFTDEAARLTPCDKAFIANINQKEFDEFSFVNTEYLSLEQKSSEISL